MPPILFRIACLLPVLSALALPARAADPAAAKEGIGVVASLLPVQGLVAGVTEGVTEPRLLVPPGASPHGYSLRPSDAAALSTARVVVWVGPRLESFLPGVLDQVAAEARVVRLDSVPGVTRLAQRQGALWGAHDHDHGDAHDHEDAHAQEHHDQEHGDEHEADHDHDHDHEAEAAHDEASATDPDADHAYHVDGDAPLDPHLWLDPRNAVAWTRAIAEALAEADPAHAATYAANAARQVTALEALDAELAETLAPVRGVPFLVFHDGYHYLEHRYGLSAVGALTLAPGQQAGARHMAEVRARVEETKARCIFGEPQVSDQLAQRLAEATGVAVSRLDPLGRAEAQGSGQYAALMRTLAADLRHCLAAE